MTQLPATKIFAMKGIGDHPADPTQLSHYHSYAPMWDITRNKVGGAGPNNGSVPNSGAYRSNGWHVTGVVWRVWIKVGIWDVKQWQWQWQWQEQRAPNQRNKIEV